MNRLLAFIKNFLNKDEKNKKAAFSLILGLFLLQICIVYFIINPAEAIIDISEIDTVDPDETQGQFIEAIAKPAQKTYIESGILPSITIAQAVLESGFGQNAPGNNLFGIKAYNWTGPTITLPTEEEHNGVTVTVMAKFRAYKSWNESIEDHKNFLEENITYIKHGVFSADNFVEQAEALQAAGYATDSSYAQKLCTIIKQYSLDKYDNLPVKDSKNTEV